MNYRILELEDSSSITLLSLCFMDKLIKALGL